MGLFLLFLFIVVMAAVICPTVIALTIIAGIVVFYILAFVGIIVTSPPAFGLLVFCLAVILAGSFAFAMIRDVLRFAVRIIRR